MWEKLQHNVDREFEEPVKSFEFNRQLKRKNTARPNGKAGRTRQYNGRVTLMDLIAIFTDEAEIICKNKTIANLIALESLRDYIKKHVGNVKIVL